MAYLSTILADYYTKFKLYFFHVFYLLLLQGIVLNNFFAHILCLIFFHILYILCSVFLGVMRSFAIAQDDTVSAFYDTVGAFDDTVGAFDDTVSAFDVTVVRLMSRLCI